MSKVEPNRTNVKRGYIAMLAVQQDFRRKGIGKELVIRSIEQMRENGAEEIVLEAEYSNKAMAAYRGGVITRHKCITGGPVESADWADL